jgi:hypothetical protein
MIKLTKHGNNETEISNGKTPVESIFFSYSTAVAGIDNLGFFKTDKKYSTTTSKHINNWLRKNNAIDNCRIISQSEINEKIKV